MRRIRTLSRHIDKLNERAHTRTHAPAPATITTAIDFAGAIDFSVYLHFVGTHSKTYTNTHTQRTTHTAQRSNEFLAVRRATGGGCADAADVGVRERAARTRTRTQTQTRTHARTRAHNQVAKDERAGADRGAVTLIQHVWAISVHAARAFDGVRVFCVRASVWIGAPRFDHFKYAVYTYI